MTNNNIFEFRGECSADAQAVRAVLLPWLMDWQEVCCGLICSDTSIGGKYTT